MAFDGDGLRMCGTLLRVGICCFAAYYVLAMRLSVYVLLSVQLLWVVFDLAYSISTEYRNGRFRTAVL